MRIHYLLSLLLFCTLTIQAQNDPVIMTVNGVPVTRSEFEYSYNKNNSEGVIDKKTVKEYVDLFVNYKLKVAAAIEAGIDTTSAFRSEFAMYRDQQIRPMVINDDDVEAEARRIYSRTQHQVDSLGGLIKPAHILLLIKQNAPQGEQERAKVRIDSIYRALQGGADFAELASRHSQDPGSAKQGGELPWCQPGQLVQEFEREAYALQKGQMSKPFLSPYGYHIVLMKDRSMFFPYDSVRTDILTFIDRRGLREAIIDHKLAEMAQQQGGEATPASVLADMTSQFTASDANLNNLIREYHDGLLLYEISNRNVWDKASKDEKGLAAYFQKHKKDYKWETPRFKGIAYHVKDKKDVKAVKKCVKGLPFDQWNEKLRTTFNADSVLRIRVEKGLFKPGDNALVDREVFGRAVTVTPTTDFPIDATYGKVLKAPQDYTDVKGQVIADYQDELERVWVAELRKRYPVVVNEAVLSTVNNHQ